MAITNSQSQMADSRGPGAGPVRTSVTLVGQDIGNTIVPFVVKFFFVFFPSSFSLAQHGCASSVVLLCSWHGGFETGAALIELPQQ